MLFGAAVAAAVSGLTRSGVPVLSALCAAVRAHLLRPPPAPPQGTGNRDPGLFVILAQHTPPGSSPALPWSSRWLLRRVLVYLRAIRGHCSPPKQTSLSALWIRAATTSRKHRESLNTVGHDVCSLPCSFTPPLDEKGVELRAGKPGLCTSVYFAFMRLARPRSFA